MHLQAAARVLVALVLTATPGFARQSVETIWLQNASAELPGDNARAVAVDGDGSIFTSTSLSGSVRLSKYDADAEPVWSRTFPSGLSFTNALVPDENGGVYAIGQVRFNSPLGGPSLGGFNDGLLLHLDAAGVTLSAQRFGGNGDELLHAAVRAPSGGLFVAGVTDSSATFGGTSFGPRDAFVARYDALGTELWVTRFGQFGTLEIFRAIAHDGLGGVVCAGRSYNPGVFENGLIARVDGSGGVVYVDRGIVNVQLRGVASDGQGGLTATGNQADSNRAVLFQADPGGTVTLNVPVTDPGLDARGEGVLRLDGGLYAVVGETANRFWTKLFSGTGVLLDELTVAETEDDAIRLKAVASNGKGMEVVFGRTALEEPFLARLSFGSVGTPGCPGEPNSVGPGGVLDAIGTVVRSDNSITLFASALPPASSCFFVTSTSGGFVANPGGSQGNLCLAGAIGRFVRPGEVLLSVAEGRVHLNLDLASIPQPNATLSIMPGQTWHYQLWYRDANPSTTSNFSSSVSVLFR